MPCPDDGDQSYYSGFRTSAEGNLYKISGTIHQNGSKRGLVRAKTLTDAEITVKGSLKRTEGDIQLVYQGVDGTIIILAEGRADSEESIMMDTTVKMKKGGGSIYFTGAPAVYEFELELDSAQKVDYYLE